MRLHRRLDSGTLEPAEYVRYGDRARLACPCCGVIETLAETYSVDPSGIVTPIWACPNAACPATVWLSLDDWED